MNRRKKAIRILLLAMLCLAGAIAAVVFGVKGMLDPMTWFAEIQSPGSLELSLEGAEPLSIWLHYPTTAAASRGTLPAEVAFALARQDGSQVPFIPVLAGEESTTSIVNESYKLLGSFEIDQPGDYVLGVTGQRDEPRQFSLIRGTPDVSVKNLFWGVGSAAVLALLSMIFLIVSLVLLFRKGSSSPPGPQFPVD